MVVGLCAFRHLPDVSLWVLRSVTRETEERRCVVRKRMILSATLAVLAALMLSVLGVGTAAAHPHIVPNPSHDQVIANGQNHPGFVTDPESGLITMCEGVLEPPDSGPAGYGLETAHHGPDAGTAGKGDGCYAVEDDAPPPPDTNPAID